MRRLEKGAVHGISFKFQEEEREKRDNWMPTTSKPEWCLHIGRIWWTAPDDKLPAEAPGKCDPSVIAPTRPIVPFSLMEGRPPPLKTMNERPGVSNVSRDDGHRSNGNFTFESPWHDFFMTDPPNQSYKM
jgi:hypothetical protein